MSTTFDEEIWNGSIFSKFKIAETAILDYLQHHCRYQKNTVSQGLNIHTKFGESWLKVKK